jgi:hypothetical protein
VNQSEFPGQQDAGKQEYRQAYAQPQRTGHAPRLTGAGVAPPKHKQQCHGKAGKNSEEYKAYKVGHNRIIF